MTPDRVQSKIHSLRRLLRRLVVMAGVSRVLLILLGIAALCLLSDWTFRLSPGTRIALALAGLVGLTAAAWRFLLRPLLVAMPDDQLALLYEREFPELSGAMVSAIQLARDAGPASPSMVSAVIGHAEEASGEVVPARVPRRTKLNRLAAVAFAAVAAAITFALAAPGAAETFARRYLDPFGPSEWPRNTRLVIEVAGSTDAEVSVARGEQVAIRVTAHNARNSPLWSPPGKVWLDYQFGSDETESRPMRRTKSNVHEAYFNDLLEDLVVRARGGDGQVGPVHVNVVELPRVVEAWLSFEYPKYTGLPPTRPSRSIQEVRAIVGTRVHVHVRANAAVRDDGAAIRVDPDATVLLAPTGDDGPTYEGTFVLASGMKRFRIELADASGLRNRNPRTFPLHVVDDKPPKVKVLRPGGQIRCTPFATLPLEATIKDDLGVRRAWLRYLTDPKRPARRQALELIGSDPRDAPVRARWDLSSLRLKVGQTLSYRVEANDFRDVFPEGSDQKEQVGRSDEYVVRIVSSADLANELDQRLFALRDQLKQAKTQQAAGRREINTLLRKISEGQALTNEDRALASRAENIQRELSRRAGRIGAEVGRVRERMQDNRIGSFADRRRLDDVRASLDDIADNAMPRAAQFIKNARKDLTSRDGRTNLQTAAGIQQTILTRMEKIIAAMAHNEDIDNLVRAARELLRKQRAIKAGTAELARRGTFGKPLKELTPVDFAALNLLVRKENGASDDMRNLEQEMLNVYQRLKERDAKRAELVQQAQLGASRDQIRVMMDAAAAKLAVNRVGLAAEHQDIAIKGLERLLERLEQAREEAGGDEALQQAIHDVDDAIGEVERLRKRQEGHAADAGEINANAEQAKRLKQLRRELKKLREEQEQNRLDAKDAAKLRAAAAKAAQHAARAQGLKDGLDKEAKAAAAQRAPQSKDIEKAADATGEARARTSAAGEAMRRGDGEKAQPPAADAERKLGEAGEHIDRAIEAIEKQRLADTREAALKQGETAKEAARVAAKLGRLAKENESASRQASTELGKAGGKVGEAGQDMQGAQANLDRNDAGTAEENATEAARKLRDAEAALKKLRDELREKQKQQTLLTLIVELQPMLQKQIEINDETRRIDAAAAGRDSSEPTRPEKVRLGQLAADEGGLGSKASELLKKVEGESAPVFAWAFRKVTKDADEVRERLARFETDAYTQDLGKDIADTLQMLIDALKREQRRSQRAGHAGGQGSHAGGKPVLVPPSAQLKLLKLRELVIHNRTKRVELKRLLKPGKKLTPLQKKRVRKLAQEQADLAGLTTELAEALERAAREAQQAQEEMP